MADMRWSDAQREAIEARGSNLLVSAAAGSGKTAVLAARILALVQEGAGIDEMLVVTFTRAAAAEMRARILTLLHDAADLGDARMAIQSMRVERADITTLHGFCGGICRGYFHAAGVDPTFRVAESAETGVLRAQAMQDALIACHENPSPAFSYAAECLSRVELIDAVDSLHRFLMARPDPWQWLDDAVAAHNTSKEVLRETVWAKVLLEKAKLAAEVAEDAYRRAADFAVEIGRYQPFAAAELAYAASFRAAAQKGLDAMLTFADATAGRKPNKPRDADASEEEAYKSLRDDGKNALKSARKAAEGLERMLERIDDLRDAGRLLEGVADACRAYDRLYAFEKEEKNLLDFSDLEHCALHALRQAEVAEAAQKKYKYVFIDEYQDSSHLQEAILGLVTRGDNLFMVGDIKQSIYRFRLAEPGLFLKKLRTFRGQPSSPNRKILLNANYRSHKALIANINDVFSQVFCGGVMELTYGEDERLTPGKLHDWPGAPAELHAVIEGIEDTESDEADDPPTAGEMTPELRQLAEREAEIIAKRIAELRNAPEGKYALRDMVILMRAVRGKAALVVETLRHHGIDAWSDAGEDTLSRVEVQTVLSLLRTIDNLRQDVPLMAALRGPALGLDDAALAEIRCAYPEGTFYDAVIAYAQKGNPLANALSGFIAKVREWATDVLVLPLDAMIRRVYMETGYYAAIGAMPDGAARQGSLRMLAEHGGQYHRAQHGGLSGFLRYVDKITSGEGLTFPDIGEADDVVRVMSIHKSKGLQFPVVFIAGLGSRFRLQENGKIQMHAELGATMPTIRPSLRTRWTSVAREAILEMHRRESLAEEARLLYVAMTRAENRLILVGGAKPSDPEKWARKISSTTVQTASRYIDWVAPCAASGDHGWKLLYHPRQANAALQAEKSKADALMSGLREIEPVGEQADALSWKAPVRSAKPLKQSVTAMTKRLADPEAMEEMSIERLAKRPLFMERRGLTATERGDAIHAFLAAVPLDANDLYHASLSMVSDGKLSAEQASVLPMRRLAAIFDSPIWQRMRAAKNVFRELPFNVRIEENGTRQLIQGIIDCCFLENGKWIVVDYKSDTVADVSVLRKKYTPQIERYAQALCDITGHPVVEKILYLIERGEGISI